MGKCLYSILVCILFFLFYNEAQGRALLGEEGVTILIGKAKQEVLSANSDTRASAIEQKAKLVVPASRCCHVIKYATNSGHAISFLPACYRQALPSNNGITVSKSNHLFYIYPFHNFW